MPDLRRVHFGWLALGLLALAFAIITSGTTWILGALFALVAVVAGYKAVTTPPPTPPRDAADGEAAAPADPSAGDDA